MGRRLVNVEEPGESRDIGRVLLVVLLLDMMLLI
jgi:hypothetical protein